LKKPTITTKGVPAYDPRTDFEPVMLVATTPMVLLARERKQRIVGHGGCGAGLIREATRWNNDLLRESAAFRQSRRKNFQRRA
jgi:hypothetical protein